MNTRPPHPHPSEHGAVAIEFALSVIILVILIFGSIGVSMGFYTYEVINEYARDASRYAIVHGNGCSHQVNLVATSCSIGTGGTANIALNTYLNNQIYPGINGNNLRVGTTYTPGPGATTCNAPACNGAGDQVMVTVTYPYLYSIPFIPQNSFTMSAASTMVISQ